jgi:hypothetical protein
MIYKLIGDYNKSFTWVWVVCVSDVIPMGLCYVCEIMFGRCHTHTKKANWTYVTQTNQKFWKIKISRSEQTDKPQSYRVTEREGSSRIIKGLGIESLK